MPRHRYPSTGGYALLRIKYGEDKYPTSGSGLEWKRIFHQDAEKVEPGAGHGKRRRAGADGN